MGATPHRLAKEASLFNLWGLSPATIKSVAALSVLMPGKETNSGAACVTSRSRCASSSTISAERASIPVALRRRASLRPRSCWYLLPRRTSRGQNPPPSGGASRSPLRSLARSTRPGFSAQMVHGHSRVEVEVRVYTQDHRDLVVRLFGADRRHVRAAPFDVALSSTRGAGENGRMCCEGSPHRRAPMRSRWLRPRAAVRRHQGVRPTGHSQGTFGSRGRRVRPLRGVAHSHSPGYSQRGRRVLRPSLLG